MGVVCWCGCAVCVGVYGTFVVFVCVCGCVYKSFVLVQHMKMIEFFLLVPDDLSVTAVKLY
jgi:hypothetical protein